MKLDQLKREMEEHSAEEISRIRTDSEAEAARSREEAGTKAESIVRRTREQAARTVARERVMQRYKAAHEAKTATTLEQNRLFEMAFNAARHELEGIRNASSYATTFRRLLEEAVRTLDEQDIRLHIDTRDADLCRSIVDELGLHCEIVEDITCIGGLDASSPDERIIVRNTLESRLERSKETLRMGVFSTLFGD
ncbi:MAG TPA: hypothetical protein ENN85_01970 [Methanoculleus sp.]|nr:hypothetical protein [Methanoculleus sp.]